MRINDNQMLLGAGAALVFAIMVIFPPWKTVLDSGSALRTMRQESPAGYGFIGSPPSGVRGYGVEIDVARLGFQVSGLLAIAGIGFVLLAKRADQSEIQARNVGRISRKFATWLMEVTPLWISVPLILYLLLFLPLQIIGY